MRRRLFVILFAFVLFLAHGPLGNRTAGASASTSLPSAGSTLRWQSGGGAPLWQPGETLIAVDHADVNGDGTKDLLLLTGLRAEPKSAYIANHTLTLVDGSSAKRRILPLGEESGGYAATLTHEDFNGDRAADVLIRIPTGGSGGIVRAILLSLSGPEPAVLFDAFNDLGANSTANGLSYVIAVVGHSRLDVTASWDEKAYRLSLPLDISQSNAEERVPMKSNEEANAERRGFIDPFGRVDPVDTNGDGTFELVGYQKIWVDYHANSIAYAKSVWAWDGSRMALADLTVQSERETFLELGYLNSLKPER